MKVGLNNKFTLLSEKQIFGRKRIDVIGQLGAKCAISDFAILLGAYVSSDYHVDGDSSLKGRTGGWYLSSSSGDGDVRIVSNRGDCICTYAGDFSAGIRPALQYSNIYHIFLNEVMEKDGLLEFEYGEYPQYAVDIELSNELDNELSTGGLKETGKTYTTNSRSWCFNPESFEVRKYYEYEYNGKKYVKVKYRVHTKSCKLSNGEWCRYGDEIWIEVAPIKWYVDKKSRLILSKICLSSGIRFSKNGQYKGNFKTTEMYMFLNKYFAKDIVPSGAHEITPKDCKLSSDSNIVIEKLLPNMHNELTNEELKMKLLVKYIEYTMVEYSKLSEMVGIDDWDNLNKSLTSYIVDMIKLKKINIIKNNKASLCRNDEYNSYRTLVIDKEVINSVFDESTFSYYFPKVRIPYDYKNIKSKRDVISKAALMSTVLPIISSSCCVGINDNIVLLLSVTTLAIFPPLLFYVRKEGKYKLLRQTKMKQVAEFSISDDSIILFKKILFKKAKEYSLRRRELLSKMRKIDGYEKYLQKSDELIEEIYSLYYGIKGYSVNSKDCNGNLDKILLVIESFIENALGSMEYALEDYHDELDRYDEKDEYRIQKIYKLSNSILSQK